MTIKQNAINERIKPLERAERVSATQVPPQPTKSTVGKPVPKPVQSDPRNSRQKVSQM